MNKKTIAYFLIAILAIGGLYFMLTKNTRSNSLIDMGASAAPTPFDLDDERAYKQIRALFPAKDYGWVDTLAKERYEYEPGYIGGNVSKAKTFLDTVGAAAPNPNGTHPATSWSGGQKLLWPDSTFVKAWEIINRLSAKYNTL